MRLILTGCATALMLACGAAHAGFHFMQIQQLSGGLGGDSSIQAIQLRMRQAGQGFVNTRRLRAFDAAGNNPVEIVTFGNNVSNANLGSTILIATADFQTATGITPDFIMTNPIPASYLPAGRVTFESGTSIYWSVSWGGTNYTGSNTGLTTNDSDGDFGPPFDGPLPSTGTTALTFGGAANASSTTNATDYSETAAGAVYTNNAGESAALTIPDLVFADGFEQP